MPCTDSVSLTQRSTKCARDRLPPKGMCSESHNLVNFWKYIIISRKLCKIETELQWKINTKLYVAYRMASLPVTYCDLEGHFCCFHFHWRISTLSHNVMILFSIAHSEKWPYFNWCNTLCGSSAVAELLVLFAMLYICLEFRFLLFLSLSLLDFVVPRTNTKVADKAFCVLGPLPWNSLPSHIRTIDSKNRFCKQLKTYVFSL